MTDRRRRLSRGTKNQSRAGAARASTEREDSPIGRTGADRHNRTNAAVIGVMLIVVGLLMAAVEKRGGLVRDLNRVSFGDAMAVGCAQALALIPGTSRSGITITAAMFLGITRHSAARFSFLLSTPIILGAGLKAFLDAMETGGIPPEMHTAFAVGVIASGIFGYAVISYFLRYLQKATLRVFVYYRVVLGVVVLALTFLTNFGK